MTPQRSPKLRMNLQDIHPFWAKPWRHWKPKGPSTCPWHGREPFCKRRGGICDSLERDSKATSPQTTGNFFLQIQTSKNHQKSYPSFQPFLLNASRDSHRSQGPTPQTQILQHLPQAPAGSSSGAGERCLLSSTQEGSK